MVTRINFRLIIILLFFLIFRVEKISTLIPLLVKIFDSTNVVRFFPIKQIVIIFNFNNKY